MMLSGKFVSYAQNHEDIMLWRALSGFGIGFYIDVGACDPMIESVTKAFYDMGWNGINIEPMKDSFVRLQANRLRDINLNVALEDKRGTKNYFSIDGGNGLSTGNKELADQYKQGNKSVKEVQVQLDTLANICDQYVNNREIHFLKIDVEGSERLVLTGADFKKYRPWIIVIESRSPEEWEEILIKNHYSFLYKDGLNRFYVANEKLSIFSESFAAPPSLVFDNFILYRELVLQEELQMANQKIKALEKELEAYYQESFESSRYIACIKKEHQTISTQNFDEITKLKKDLENTNTNLTQNFDELTKLKKDLENTKLYNTALLNSFSWKITTPVRKISRILKKYA